MFGLRRFAGPSMATAAFRYQSAAAAAAATTSAAAAPSQSRPQRPQRTARVVHNVEFYDVRDAAAQGSMLSLAYVQAQSGQNLFRFSFVPQLGPRKLDPNDPSPQFDVSARRSFTLKPHSVAGVLLALDMRCAKCEVGGGNTKLDITPEENGGFKLSLATTPAGQPTSAVAFTLAAFEAEQLSVMLKRCLYTFWRFK
jgi:hypothetical protein